MGAGMTEGARDDGGGCAGMTEGVAVFLAVCLRLRWMAFV